jgi:hypothetical protein
LKNSTARGANRNAMLNNLMLKGRLIMPPLSDYTPEPTIKTNSQHFPFGPAGIILIQCVSSR